jgi:hypothetical protein
MLQFSQKGGTVFEEDVSSGNEGRPDLSLLASSAHGSLKGYSIMFVPNAPAEAAATQKNQGLENQDGIELWKERFNNEHFTGLQGVDFQSNDVTAEMVLNLRIVDRLNISCDETRLLLGGWDNSENGCRGSTIEIMEPTVAKKSGGGNYHCVRSKLPLLPNAGVQCFEFVTKGGGSCMHGLVSASVEPEKYSDQYGIRVAKSWYGMVLRRDGHSGDMYNGAQGFTHKSNNDGTSSLHDGLGIAVDMSRGTMRFYNGGKEIEGTAITNLPNRKPLYLMTGLFLQGQAVRLQLPQPGQRNLDGHWALKAMTSPSPRARGSSNSSTWSMNSSWSTNSSGGGSPRMSNTQWTR